MKPCLMLGALVGLGKMLLNPSEVMEGLALEASDFDIEPPESRIIRENGQIVSGPSFGDS